eukprot:532151-Hanusia_phi.AAC.1
MDARTEKAISFVECKTLMRCTGDNTNYLYRASINCTGQNTTSRTLVQDVTMRNGELERHRLI